MIFYSHLGKADVICHERKDGVYTNLYNRNQYVECKDGKPVGECQNCPPGKVYKEKCYACVHKSYGEFLADII